MAELTPYYERNGITIYCGDCLEVMAWLYNELRLVFDAIICDLPYGVTACKWDVVIPFEPLWENYKRLVKRAGAVVLFGSQPFTSMLVMSNLEWFKYEWVWIKNVGSNFLNANRQPMKENEDILVFCLGKLTYNEQRIERMDKQRALYRDGAKKNNGKEVYGDYSFKSGYRADIRTRCASTVLKFNREVGLHPTQKPLALLQYLTRTYTNPNDLILDNTMGSGTTLLAAQNEGRQAVGIEISEKCCKIAVERLKQPSFFSIPDKPKVEPAKQLGMVI